MQVTTCPCEATHRRGVLLDVRYLFKIPLNNRDVNYEATFVKISVIGLIKNKLCACYSPP